MTYVCSDLIEYDNVAHRDDRQRQEVAHDEVCEHEVKVTHFLGGPTVGAHLARRAKQKLRIIYETI